MISSTSPLSAPPMIGGVQPTSNNNAPTRRHGPGQPQGRGTPKSTPPLAAPAPAKSALTRFLQRPCMELAVNYALEPEITISNLQHPATFDGVLYRSRKVLREACAQGGADGAVFRAALQILDGNVVLRNQSRVCQTSLYQG